MQMILHFRAQSLLLKPPHFFFSPIFKPSHLLKDSIFAPRSHKPHTQNPIQCARNNNKRPKGSLRLQKSLLRLVPIIASNLKILPPPFDLVVEQICGGYGGGDGGLGMWKGFGGGGFDGFRSKRNRKLLLLFVFCGIFMVCGLRLLVGRELESNVVWFGLWFGAIGVALVHWWEKRVFFGLFVLGVLVGSGFKSKELKNWVLKIRNQYPIVEHFITLRRTPRRRRTRTSGKGAF